MQRICSKSPRFSWEKRGGGTRNKAPRSPTHKVLARQIGVHAGLVRIFFKEIDENMKCFALLTKLIRVRLLNIEQVERVKKRTRSISSHLDRTSLQVFLRDQRGKSRVAKDGPPSPLGQPIITQDSLYFAHSRIQSFNNFIWTVKSLIFTSVAYPANNPQLCGLRFLIPDFRDGFVQNEGNRRSLSR